MPKKSSVPPLPPLSFDALKVVQHYETYAHRALLDSYRHSGRFVEDKATEILRTCVIAILNAQIGYYSRLPNFHPEWISQIKLKIIKSSIGLLDSIAEYNYGSIFLTLQRTVEDHMRAKADESKQTAPASPKRVDRKKLAASYFALFPDETIKILDVCWAVGQHYREWKRWLKNELKDGSTPDLAFRRILSSGKRPHEFSSKPRPAKWQ